MRSRPSAVAFVLGAVLCLTFTACSSSTDRPTRPGGRATTPSASPPSASSPAGTGYVVSDVRLVKTPDPVAQVVWSASFDARWTADGEAEETRCRWKLLDAKGVSIADGIVDIRGNDLDDFQTPPIYPDEFAGVPRSARVIC